MKFRNIISTLLVILTLAIAPTKAQKYKASNIFPYHKQLEKNIGFWNKIYAEYNSDQILIHHKDDFKIYYELNFSNQLSSLSEKEKEKKKEILDKIADNIARSYEMLLRLDSIDINELEKIQNLSKYKEKEMRIRTQSGQSDKFRQAIIESGAYIDSIFTILREENVPEDIAALIFVESMFDPKAGSKAGALGIWQLTEGVANKIYDEDDIKLVNKNFDHRTDIFKSTRKAAKILKNNYEKLEKWDLAILAYNYGLNGTQRAAEKHKDLIEIINNHNTNIFGFAAKNFYSEFLAALYVWKNYEKIFGELKLKEPEDIQNIIYTKKLQLLKEKTKIQPIKKNFKLENYLVPTSFDIHEVKKDETLPEISINHNTDLEKIMFFNGLKNSAIYVNQKLLIPNESQPDTTYFIHIVKQGHTLSHIVDFYVKQYNLENLRIKKIKEYNNLELDIIKEGQELKIPVE